MGRAREIPPGFNPACALPATVFDRSTMPAACPAPNRPHVRRIATGVALACLLALSTGCSLLPRSKPKADAEPSYAAPEHQTVGRVLSHDAAARTVLVEIGFHSTPPARLEGQVFVTRHPDTLAVSGKLVASRYRTGRVLGARVLEGAPAPEDEVVTSPALALETAK